MRAGVNREGARTAPLESFKPRAPRRESATPVLHCVPDRSLLLKGSRAVHSESLHENAAPDAATEGDRIMKAKDARKLATAGAGVLALAAGVAWMNVAPAQDPDETVMRQKLRHSQNALEGLAIKDFGKLKESGEYLVSISIMDSFAKFLRDDAEYDRHAENFRAAAGRIIESADAKNIEGAALAYMDMTMTCVQCHEHLRDAKK